MDEQSIHAQGRTRSTDSTKKNEGQARSVLDAVNFHFRTNLPVVATAADSRTKFCNPISSIMQQNVTSVYAENTVDHVERVLTEKNLLSVPVRGSNGAIVGIIGPEELARFHLDKKNAKAVRAWEISRCTMFQVSPDYSVEDVAKLMVEHRIEYIAVAKHGVLKGVVSALDLVQAISNENTAGVSTR